MDRARRLAPLLVLLVLFGACLGSKGKREACACGPERAEGTGATEGVEPSSPAATREHSPEPASLAGARPAAGASAAASLPDFTDPSWTRTPSRAGQYLVCWRSVGGSVPRNEDFELEVWVLADGRPVRDATVAVSAWMPDHGHGMLRQPRAEARDDGSYRVAGMLLHMRGHWLLRFEVLEGSLSETAECALDL